MPELPEVETMRRGVLAVVGGQIVKLRRPPCRLRPITVRPAWATLRRRIEGRTIQAVDRLGKRVVLVLDDQSRLVFEPRMTGLVLLADPPNQTHLRLELQLAGVSAHRLWFWDRRGLGQVLWFSEREYACTFLDGRLGPDAWGVSAELLRQRLGASRRPLKVALLDQQALAGIGNLYASEILFEAGLHPARRATSLGADEWIRLAKAMQQVLDLAVRYEGSTLGDGTYRNALNQQGSFQNLHRVYDKAGQRCRRCQAADVVRMVQAQRSTFFCPTCQPRGRK